MSVGSGWTLTHGSSQRCGTVLYLLRPAKLPPLFFNSRFFPFSWSWLQCSPDTRNNVFFVSHCKTKVVSPTTPLLLIVWVVDNYLQYLWKSERQTQVVVVSGLLFGSSVARSLPHSVYGFKGLWSTLVKGRRPPPPPPREFRVILRPPTPGGPSAGVSRSLLGYRDEPSFSLCFLSSPEY